MTTQAEMLALALLTKSKYLGEQEQNDLVTIVNELGKRPMQLNGRIPDVSTANSTAYFVSPYAGKITKVGTVLEGAITVADSVVQAKINGTDVTGGSFTIANASSAAGDKDTAVPTAANTVAVGDVISLVSDGGSTTAMGAAAFVEITPL